MRGEDARKNESADYGRFNERDLSTLLIRFNLISAKTICNLEEYTFCLEYNKE